MRCGLYFGSFNPMHIGHLSVCNYLCAFTSLDRVVLVLSPHNPLKARQKESLPELYARLSRIDRLFKDKGLPVRVSDMEFSLPEPLYTYNTLCRFRAQEPDTEFVLVIGADNLASFDRWYAWERIMEEFAIMVYPRKGYDAEALALSYSRLPCKGITVLDAPLVSVSSSFIRSGIEAGKNMNGFCV